jgi:hypothetical protein
VIVAKAEATAIGDPQAFNLFAQSTDVTLVTCRETEELLIGNGHRGVRLSIVHGTLLKGPVRLVYQLTGTDALDTRLLALRRFASFQLRGRFPTSLFAPRKRTRRWHDAVRALDALAVNPSHRAVAAHLYGEKAAAEWYANSDSLQSRVRRLIGLARNLATGDYLDLLRK